MASGITTSFEVTGVAPFLARLQEVSDPRRLERTTRASLGSAGRKVIAPRLAETSGWTYGGHGGAYPTKGILGQRGKVTARRVRTRQGEYVAVSVKFRGWPGTVAAWVVKGTRPHVIAATGRGPYGRHAPSSVVRSINRNYIGKEFRSSGALTRTGKALVIRGQYRERVQHPGARPTPFVHGAVQGTERLVMEALSADLFRQMDRAARGKR